MPKQTSITCDHCGTELIVDTSMPAKYSLKLETVNTAVNSGGFVYGISMMPELKQTAYFCGLKCLAEWCAAR